MKIEKTYQDDHQVKLIVEIEPESLETSKRKAAKQLAKRIKIPGFRPGKAPYNVIETHVGEGAILESALDILVEDIYPQVITEAEIDPFGPGSLQEIPALDPPKFEFIVPLAPKVEIKEHRSIRVDFSPKEVTDKDIKKVIDNLRDNQAVLEPVEREVKVGDMVYVLLSGERKEVEGKEKQVLIEERRFPVVVEKKSTENKDEYPYPGFSRNLIGLSPGDEKSLEHKFPKNYEYDDLKGVTGIYQVKIEEVKSRSLPKVTDEFAKSVGDYETVDGMTEDIRANLAENFEKEQNAEYESEIINKLLEDAEIKYPPQLLEHEVDHFIQDLNRQLANQGMSIEMYLKSREIDMDELREEINPNAVERVKRGLVLMEIANLENISVNQDEVQRRANQTIAELRQILPEEEARKYTTSDALQNLVSQIITDEITTLTLERIKKIARGEEITEDEDNSEEEKPEIEEQAAAEAAVSAETEEDQPEPEPEELSGK